jgi:tRNA A-37 threonylcarbamoyl transferase component Bud32
VNQAFVRCPHCGLPHEHIVLVCPSTGLAIPKGGKAPLRPMGLAIPPIPEVPRPALRPSTNRTLEGRIIGDKYRMLGPIGEGGMGTVYEAEHTTIGRLVAVKVLHPKNAQNKDAVSRMHHEARVVGTIGHPNICEIYDIGRLDDGSPYLVMERLHGETLAERLLREGPLLFPELVDVMVQVLSALVIAHDKGIIHRDLKPDNIFLSQRAGMPPLAKLLDFGISKAQNIDDSAVDITRTGMVMGTPYYMAPEQARGDRRLDHRVDLWAVGVILYEGLAGRRPFVARNYNALLVQILTSRHRPVGEFVTGLPAALIEVIDRSLAKMREDRFQSASEVLERLLELRRATRSAPPAPGAVVPHEARFGHGRSLLTRGTPLGLARRGAEGEGDAGPVREVAASVPAPPPPMARAVPPPPSSQGGARTLVPAVPRPSGRKGQSALVDPRRVVARQIIDIPPNPPSSQGGASGFEDQPTLPRMSRGAGTQLMLERVPRPRVPSFAPVDESTSDDATVVIPRRALDALRSPPPSAPPVEDSTQQDPTLDEYDADETIVESPSFLTDGVPIDKASRDRR